MLTCTYEAYILQHLQSCKALLLRFQQQFIISIAAWWLAERCSWHTVMPWCVCCWVVSQCFMVNRRQL
jgi:hypothetical protein